MKKLDATLVIVGLAAIALLALYSLSISNEANLLARNCENQ